MPRGVPLDLIGQRFGRWTVVGKAERQEPGPVLWVCRCECGAMGRVRTSNLRAGMSRGCKGCSLVRARLARHGR